jgi:polar amino acid transport system substrate-binding protein
MKLFQLKKRIALGLSFVMLFGSLTACQASKSGSNATSNAASQASANASGQSSLLQDIKKKGYITIGSSNDAPFSYTDVSTGKLAGVDVEILRAVCSKLGIADVQLKVIDFSNLLVELNNNSVDMVVDGML